MRKIGRRLYNRLTKIFVKVEKRQRFIISTTLLAILYTAATFFSFEEIYIYVPLIFIAVYFLTFFSILEGLTRHEWIMLFIHPIYFSIVFYLFYFFVPQRWLTRLPFLTIYIISTYAILLSQNIFNVGVTKSLQLFRAAFSVNYLFLTIGSFLAYSLIISLRLHFAYNLLLVFFASFPLVLQFLWSIEPKDYITGVIIRYSLIISLLLGEASVLLSFMPVNQAIFALVLTSVFYSLTGLFQIHIQGALFRERIREYVFVLGFALIVLVLTLNW